VKVNEPITSCLIDQIRTKHYPLGSVLPTEHELQQKFNASRYAVRESLRELVAMGLIARKPKTGSVVVSVHEERSFVQSHGSIDDLFTYIKNSKLIVLDSKEVRISTKQFNDLALPVGATWKKIKVLRQKIKPALPLVASEIFTDFHFNICSIFAENPDHDLEQIRCIPVFFTFFPIFVPNPIDA
jgi:DNA-binding GntR family transcriptional regulator